MARFEVLVFYMSVVVQVHGVGFESLLRGAAERLLSGNVDVESLVVAGLRGGGAVLVGGGGVEVVVVAALADGGSRLIVTAPALFFADDVCHGDRGLGAADRWPAIVLAHNLFVSE